AGESQRKMRWFVEVAPSSQSEPAEKWVVEATQWQPALQAARSLRGEAAEMSGFSIELLEDGFRAVDPTTFVRYVVRRAPDETPVSNPRPKAPGREQNGDASVPPPAASPGQAPASKAARIAAMLEFGTSQAGTPVSRPPPASDAPAPVDAATVAAEPVPSNNAALPSASETAAVGAPSEPFRPSPQAT